MKFFSVFFGVFSAIALGCSGEVLPPEGGGGSGVGDAGGGGRDASGGGELPTSCDGTSLTQWEQMMLDSHNDWRASVSPPAADMYRVYWDSAIAMNAANWVSSCDPDWPHSSEEARSNIGGYEILGENLSYCAGTGCSDQPLITDDSGKGDGEGWWDERTDYDLATDTSTGFTAHYTQMVSANVYSIGCATQHCEAPGPGNWDGTWWWTICQYGPRGDAYWSGNRPYEVGDGDLIDPPATVFDKHSALCSPE